MQPSASGAAMYSIRHGAQSGDGLGPFRSPPAPRRRAGGAESMGRDRDPDDRFSPREPMGQRAR
jgi:hypothetical protein